MKWVICITSLLAVAAVELEHGTQAVTNQQLEDAVTMVQGIVNENMDAGLQEKVKPEAMSMMMDTMRPMLEPLLEQKGLTWEELSTPQGLMKAMLPSGENAPPGMDKFREGLGALLQNMRSQGEQQSAQASRDPNAPLDTERLQRSMNTAKGLLRPLLEPAMAKQNVEWGNFNSFVDSEVDALKQSKTMPEMLETMKQRMMKDFAEQRQQQAASEEPTAAGAVSPFGAEAGGLGEMAKMFGETFSKLRESPEAAQEATDNMKSKVFEMLDKMPGADKSKGLLQKMMNGQEITEGDIDTLPGMDNPQVKEAMKTARASAKKWGDKMKGALGDFEDEDGATAAPIRLETGAKTRKSKEQAMAAVQGVMKEQAQELGGMIRQMLARQG